MGRSARTTTAFLSYLGASTSATCIQDRCGFLLWLLDHNSPIYVSNIRLLLPTYCVALRCAFPSIELQGLWCQGLERLDLCFFSLERLLRRHCPSLRQHLSDEGVELSMFTSRWFVTLFTSTDVFGRGTSRKVRMMLNVEHVDVEFKRVYLICVSADLAHVFLHFATHQLTYMRSVY